MPELQWQLAKPPLKLARECDYIPCKTGVITYLCSNINQSLSVKWPYAISPLNYQLTVKNTLIRNQNGCHFVDIFKHIFYLERKHFYFETNFAKLK